MKNNEKTTRKQRKDKVITFRLTLEDLTKYEQFCIREQIQMSAWLRQQVKEKIDALPELQLI